MSVDSDAAASVHCPEPEPVDGIGPEGPFLRPAHAREQHQHCDECKDSGVHVVHRVCICDAAFPLTVYVGMIVAAWLAECHQVVPL